MKDDAIKAPARTGLRAWLVNTVTVSVGVGSFFLFMLAIVPIWNANSLLKDFNYVFWAGRRVPEFIIVACFLTIMSYAIVAAVFFQKVHASAWSEQNVMMLANVFIILFGLILMIVSLPLEWQAATNFENLMHNCDTSAATHRLYEYSQVLQNIRAQPECQKKYSVEECEGYRESLPYTEYLKMTEFQFRCAGFCYNPAAQQAAQQATASSLLAVGSRAKKQRVDSVTPLSLAAESTMTKEYVLQSSGTEAASSYPPTLFSDANFKASCEGMAARDMQNFAGDIGRQTFFQGIYLILIAVCTGFLKLMGFCVRKDA
jgi:hypothetical protein